MVLFSFLSVIHLLFLKVKKKLVLITSLLALFVLMAYRAVSVGTDTVNYQTQFDLVSNGTRLFVEPFWYLINKGVVLLGGSFEHVLIVSSLLTLLPVYFVVYKKSVYPLLSIFLYLTLYYYFYSFNIIRQGIALSWGLLAIASLIDNKKRLFILFVLVASLFHYSALILVPATFLVKFLSKNRNTIPIQLITLIVGLFFYHILIDFILKVFYSGYQIERGLNFIGNLLFLLILNFLFIVISNIIRIKDQWYYFFFSFVLLSNILARVPYGNRFIMFLGITQLIFMPALLKNNTLSRKQQGLIYIVLILYAYTMFYTVLGAGEIFPYINTLISL